MNLKLYIGAHKTATTHVQNLLANNRELLSSQQTSLSIPPDTRQEWLPLLIDYLRTKNSDTLNKIRGLAPKTETWILAEENIPGVSNELRIKPGLYTDLEKRLQGIKEAYPNANIEVYFSVRSYESFYRSAYLEVVRNKGYFPFHEFYDSNRFKSNSWVNVAESITNVFDQKQIYMWRYEDFSTLLPSILKHLTSLSDDAVQDMINSYKVRVTRPSISAKTLQLLASSTTHSKDESIQLLEQLNEHYPANQQNGYYQPFNPEINSSFKEQYKLDIQAVKNNYPSINFLSI